MMYLTTVSTIGAMNTIQGDSYCAMPARFAQTTHPVMCGATAGSTTGVTKW